MFKYFFILGRNPNLSFLEIQNIINRENISFEVESFENKSLLISVKSKINLHKISSILGGCVKSGEILDEFEKIQEIKTYDSFFSIRNLTEKYFPNLKKAKFSLNINQLDCNNLSFNKFFKKRKEWCVRIKEELLFNHIKAGFFQLNTDEISSLSILKNNLLNKGADINVFIGDKKIYFGKTQFVQDVFGFIFRDYYKPCKNKKSGIIPVKLARIMLNLANLNKNDVLLDPFCGDGTILLEGVMLGVKNIIGSDISPSAVSNLRNNIKWLFNNREKAQLIGDSSDYKIKSFVIDVRKISSKIENVDAIVTEPYLGPTQEYSSNEDQINRVIYFLEKMYIESFIQFSKILKLKGRIIIIFPIFISNFKKYYLNILDKIENLGFENILLDKDYNLKFSNRSSIEVISNNKFVSREVFIFSKK